MKTKKKILLAAKILLVLYLGTVLALCLCNLQSGPDIPSFIFGFPADKVLHFLMFLPYPFLIYGAFHNMVLRPYGHMLMLLTILLSGAAFAGFIELAQSMTGYRSCEASDLLADMLGLLASSFVLICASEIYHKW